MRKWVGQLTDVALRNIQNLQCDRFSVKRYSSYFFRTGFHYSCKLTCLAPCSTESRYTATREHIHSVGASSTVQTWVTSALIDVWFEIHSKMLLLSILPCGRKHLYKVSWICLQVTYSLTTQIITKRYIMINDIHEKILDSDWLRAVQFKCTSVKSATPVQITHRYSGLWLA